MEAQQFWDDIPSRQSGYRLLATCQVPLTLKSSTKVLGRLKKKAASLTVYFFQSKLSWSWLCRHRAPAVASSCPSRSVRRTPALQPQSACIICLHHATPRHADAQGLAPCEKRWRNKVAKERAKAGLGNIWNLALGTSPAKPPSVPALNSTDFRFLFSSDCTASQAFASHFKAKTGVVPASAPGFFCSNLVSSSEAVYIYIYIMTVYLYLIISCAWFLRHDLFQKIKSECLWRTNPLKIIQKTLTNHKNSFKT